VQTIKDDVRRKTFVFIPDSKATFFEQDELFGEAVNKAFPSAINEIKDAGNCLAADLNTAAVFHLMRISEYGLRVLAEQLGAIPAKWPIEFSQWKDIISDIETNLKSKGLSVDQMTKGYDKDNALELYNGLLADVKHLKVTRDKVMHARGSCDEKEALRVFNHVRGFMQRLAAKLSE
jgi:hypothetical protein